MMDCPYLRTLRFTRPLDSPTAKLAIAMLLRMDAGTRVSIDDAGRIVAVYSGRDHSWDIGYVAGKFAHANLMNMGHRAPVDSQPPT